MRRCGFLERQPTRLWVPERGARRLRSSLLCQAWSPPAVEVIRARALIADGRATEALTMLATLEDAARDRRDMAILRLTRANGLYITGEHDELARQLLLVVRDADAPVLIRQVATTWLQMVEANRGGSISIALKSLQGLARDISREGLYYFAGVARHNAAGALLAMGRYREARSTAFDALAIPGQGRWRNRLHVVDEDDCRAVGV